MRFTHFVIGGLLICWTAAAPAAPHITGAKPEPFTVKPGKHLQQRLAEKQKGKTFISTYPLATPLKVLFLRVDFPPDNDATTTGTGEWSDTTYAFGTSTNSVDYWVNKNKTEFENYYNEVSYGKLPVNVTIMPPIGAAVPAYRLPNLMASYSDSNASGIICDSIKAAESTVDFSLYDALIVVHAGAGEETDIGDYVGLDTSIPPDGVPDSFSFVPNSPGDFWSQYYPSKTAICPSASTTAGQSIMEAVVMPQTNSQDPHPTPPVRTGVVDPLGVYVHEFGHWLGLPDLYATGIFPWDGIGQWGIMGSGAYNKGADGIMGSAPTHPEAWSKVYLGWVTPTVLSSASDPGVLQTLMAVQSSPPQIIKIPASTTTTSQYFLLENRQKTGFDQDLPGDGLLVWFVNETVVTTYMPYNQVNANPARPGVSLREADGNTSLITWEAGCSTTGATPACDDGSAGDPFPGATFNTTFTPRTTPNSKPHEGFGWVNLKNISIDSVTKLASFYVGFGPPPPASVNVAISGSSAAMSWTPTTASDLAIYHVYQNGAKIAETTGTSYSLSGSASDSYQVLGVDTNLNVGDLSAAASITVSSGSSGGGGGCFIATAAFGSYEAPAVQLLRNFRDEYLLTNAAGKRFVEFYYSTSPPIAATIADSEVLKALVRFLLLPWIVLAWFFVQVGSVAEVVTVIVAGAALVLALAPKRNTSQGSL